MLLLNEKADLLSMNISEISEFLTELGEPKYRAKQIFSWLHRGVGIDGMTDVSKKLREKLSERAVVDFPKIDEKLVSKLDGTVKYLMELWDSKSEAKRS